MLDQNDNLAADSAIMAVAAGQRTVAVVGLPGVQSLDVVGPMEVFAVANLHARRESSYRVILGTPDGKPLATHAGFEMGPATPLAAMPLELDTIVVTGGSEPAMRAAVADGPLIPWLRERASGSRRIASVCTGAFILAAAGFLDGRCATTHWSACSQLQNLFPAVRVERDAIFVSEPPFYTSAGVTAGIDLSLALWRRISARRRRWRSRGNWCSSCAVQGGQSQFSAGLDVQVSTESRLHRLVTEVVEDPSGDLSVPALASRAGMSERNFSRSFHREVGTPPQFVEMARLGRAKALLESSSWTMGRIAERAGFGSTDSVHRGFQKRLGISPAEYRRRFAAPA